MLPNGELLVLSIRKGAENHLYNCRVLIRPTGQTLTSSTAGRILLFLFTDSTARTTPVIVKSVAQVAA